tara:strand:- start:1491 stop:3563 length:2073 start_codon:yes stop_codon:yes gene_type:complete
VEFLNSKDEMRMIEYLQENLVKVSKLKGSKKPNRSHSIGIARSVLQERKSQRVELGEDIEDWHQPDVEELIHQYIIAMSGINPESREYVDDSSKDIPENWMKSNVFSWGEWWTDSWNPVQTEDGEPIGYSKQLSATWSPPGGGTIHFYKNNPPPLNWKFKPVEQKGVTFLIGAAKVAEIDAVSSVPALPEELTSEECGERVGDRTRGKDEWQRRVNDKRVLSIKDFIGKSDNIIANSCILYAPPNTPGISHDQDGTITVDFSKFLTLQPTSNSGKVLCDHNFSAGAPGDQRPIWLIDGQHRVRGLAQSEVGTDLEIPIILFVEPFSLMQSAKVFAEINTLQKKLDALHTLFMQHRFQIPSPLTNRDFQKYSIDDVDTWDSRQNHLSYECAGWLACHEGGPLYGRIMILNSNSAPKAIIKANSWVDYSRDWFSEGGPYPTDTSKTNQVIFQEVENYFTALVNTCNHDEWADDENRWSLNSKNKGVLQFHSSSQAVLRIYSTVHLKASKGWRKKSEPISVERFMEVLKPFKWVDWRHADVLRKYRGSGEVPRTSLRVWMETAIQHGKQYSLADVMSNKHRSLPGRGILAPPNDSKVEITNKVKWPEKKKKQAIILASKRPDHALATSRWMITCSKKRTRLRAAIQANAGTKLATLKLGHEDWMDDVTGFTVRVEWSNVNEPDAFAELVVKKP